MYRRLAVFALVAMAGLAQSNPILSPLPRFSPALRDYLGLSGQQLASLTNLNVEYSRYQTEKYQRTAQVHLEIAQETARHPPDPMALGLRYVELETIRRELAEGLEGHRKALLAVLDTAQKSKLQVVEDAAKLQPLIAAAQCENLLTLPPGQILPVPRVMPLGSVRAAGQICGFAGEFTPLPRQP